MRINILLDSCNNMANIDVSDDNNNQSPKVLEQNTTSIRLYEGDWQPCQDMWI
jgi:hypothetical protein